MDTLITNQIDVVVFCVNMLVLSSIYYKHIIWNLIQKKVPFNFCLLFEKNNTYFVVKTTVLGYEFGKKFYRSVLILPLLEASEGFVRQINDIFWLDPKEMFENTRFSFDQSTAGIPPFNCSSKKISIPSFFHLTPPNPVKSKRVRKEYNVPLDAGNRKALARHASSESVQKNWPPSFKVYPPHVQIFIPVSRLCLSHLLGIKSPFSHLGRQNQLFQALGKAFAENKTLQEETKRTIKLATQNIVKLRGRKYSWCCFTKKNNISQYIIYFIYLNNPEQSSAEGRFVGRNCRFHFYVHIPTSVRDRRDATLLLHVPFTIALSLNIYH